MRKKIPFAERKQNMLTFFFFLSLLDSKYALSVAYTPILHISYGYECTFLGSCISATRKDDERYLILAAQMLLKQKTVVASNTRVISWYNFNNDLSISI